MAWLKLTHVDGRKAILNTDQISEISERNGSIETGIRSDGTLMFFRESVEEIEEMIRTSEARKSVERIFLAIVYNFPHGYDPDEIWDAANTLDSAGPCRDVIIDD
jgi:uncharacterized protein YlzI (FlbEa/FlbD family)